MEIGTPELYKEKAPKQYYTLVSVNDSSKIIYTPVENVKVYLRSAMSKIQCEQFLDSLPDVEAKEGWNGRTMIEEFRADATTRHCIACAEWIKALYLLQEKKYQNGKKQLTGTEKNCLRLAETYLYEELADVLVMSVAEVKAEVLKRLGLTE